VRGRRQREVIGYQQSPTVGEGLEPAKATHLVDEDNLLWTREIIDLEQFNSRKRKRNP
jgi:hypothetical protein